MILFKKPKVIFLKIYIMAVIVVNAVTVAAVLAFLVVLKIILTVKKTRWTLLVIKIINHMIKD